MKVVENNYQGVREYPHLNRVNMIIDGLVTQEAMWSIATVLT